MTLFKLTLLAKACIITGLALTSPTLIAAEKTIPELVDAVNGTPDAASREAGKKVKLRNHTKGFCTSGYFASNPELQDSLTIPFFNQSQIKVTARFSLGGTNPQISDKTPGRFMSLKIDGDKENLNFVTTNVPVFFASNLDDFFTFQTKVKQGAEGKQWLIDNKPDAKAFFDYVKQLPPSPSFANSRYFGVNSFLFTDKQNNSVAGKWIFEPVVGTAALSASELANLGDDFLKAELLQRINTQPAQWNLYIQLAESGDDINNPTVIWPETRKRLLVGQVVINGDRDSDPQVQQCDKGIFNPLLLPKGIAPSADPILNARTAAYVESFIRRQ
ncbi:catalase [Shewanella xiamenensis]|uniref:catalase family peroxidase n=1 Tax=Shewanella xiamenensis TaxID=332186 RepID=UPI00118523D6|nr:catalase family peroxidase [Shewanella xiamenensis]TVL18439.1 catalase [Shewanella xiamenensis]TVL19273.1 catalase [Shewanella xiamenensis]TVL25611.1 catalase [Shewanella xiamenensis]TVL32153.1 catalase [Shewanella xiamenensis]TVP01422.1 catalase [Shewanella xiamenensis]